MYLNPVEVDINDPPTIVKSIKNKDKFKFVELVDIPDVDIDEVIAKKIFANPSLGIINK